MGNVNKIKVSGKEKVDRTKSLRQNRLRQSQAPYKCKEMGKDRNPIVATSRRSLGER